MTTEIMYALCKTSPGNLRGEKIAQKTYFLPPANILIPEFMLPEVYTKKWNRGVGGSCIFSGTCWIDLGETNNAFILYKVV